MAKPTNFERCALLSRLLTPEQLDQAHAAVEHFPTGPLAVLNEQQLADKLVELGHLNRWQAKQLMAGRTKFNLGMYWIVDSLGAGGMGQVFKAEHGVLRRLVAVKVLPRDKCTPEAIANFGREIRAQARLDHPNLVRAFDAGEDGKVFYLVTEYVPGTDLRHLVRAKGPLDMETAAGIIAQVALGLQHAHDNGLVHRDVKPGNVLVTPDGHAKLSDLGLAGPLGGGDEEDPRFGRIVGTIDYLSPEHIQAPDKPMPAWDVYSLGCTLYYAVTGKVPFPGGSTAEKARAHCQLRPLDPKRLNNKLSAEFVEVIAEMMAKEPSGRTPTAAAAAARLAPWVRPLPGAGGGPSSLMLSLALPPALADRAKEPPRVADPQAQDTQSSFPDISESLAPERADGLSQASQGTFTLNSELAQTDSNTMVPITPPQPPGSMAVPLAILLLIPAGIVGLIVLVWAVARAM